MECAWCFACIRGDGVRDGIRILRERSRTPTNSHHDFNLKQTNDLIKAPANEVVGQLITDGSK